MYGYIGITDILPRLMLVDVWIPLYIAPKPKLNCWNCIRHFYASLVSCFLPHSSCHTDGNKKWSFLPFYWNGNVFFAVCNLLRIHFIYISEAFYQCFLFTRIVQTLELLFLKRILLITMLCSIILKVKFNDCRLFAVLLFIKDVFIQKIAV